MPAPISRRRQPTEGRPDATQRPKRLTPGLVQARPFRVGNPPRRPVRSGRRGENSRPEHPAGPCAPTVRDRIEVGRLLSIMSSSRGSTPSSGRPSLHEVGPGVAELGRVLRLHTSSTRPADLAFCGGEARWLTPGQQAVRHHQRTERRGCHRPGCDVLSCTESRARSHRLMLAAAEVVTERRERGCRNRSTR